MTKSPEEIANEVLLEWQPEPYNSVSRILAQAVLDQSTRIKELDIAIIQKAMTTFSTLQKANELQAEALKSARRLISEYINDGASDGRAMECGSWIHKHGPMINGGDGG